MGILVKCASFIYDHFEICENGIFARNVQVIVVSAGQHLLLCEMPISGRPRNGETTFAFAIYIYIYSICKELVEPVAAKMFC